jgi:uncharacterized protein YeaO (DUF488 family)
MPAHPHGSLHCCAPGLHCDRGPVQHAGICLVVGSNSAAARHSCSPVRRCWTGACSTSPRPPGRCHDQTEACLRSHSRTDGARFLVERLWLRGFSKDELDLTAWLKDVGPSTGLRQWFHHDPLKWSRFRERYFHELDAHPESWRPILAATRQGRVTLVYSSRDTAHNNAVALHRYLQSVLTTHRASRSIPAPERPRRGGR